MASLTTSNAVQRTQTPAALWVAAALAVCCVAPPRRCYGIACVGDALHTNQRSSQRGLRGLSPQAASGLNQDTNIHWVGTASFDWPAPEKSITQN